MLPTLSRQGAVARQHRVGSEASFPVQVLRQEGVAAFYRSLPTTLFMNVPYGCVLVATNESIKEAKFFPH